MLTTVKIFNTTIRAAMQNNIVRLSMILILIIIAVSTSLLSINVVGKTYRYSIGDIAREDIRVTSDIAFKIDTETEMERKRVSEMVPLVFDRDQSVLYEKLKLIDDFFDYVAITLREVAPLNADDRSSQMMTLKSRLPRYLQFNDKVLMDVIKSRNLKELQKITKRITIYILDAGILDTPYDNPLGLNNRNVTIRVVNSAHEANEKSSNVSDLRTLQQVYVELYSICKSIAPNLPTDELSAVYTITRGMVSGNLNFNIDETRRRIDESVSGVKPVMGMLKKGQTLVRQGDTITTETLNKISILNTYTTSSHVNYILGILLLQVSFLMIFGYFLLEYHARLLPDRKTPLVIFSIVMVFIIYTFFISRTENILNSTTIFSLYLPIPAVTMLIATMFNMFIAIIIGLYVIFFSFVASGASLPVIILSFSSALLGVFVLTDVERRTDFLRGGLILGIINSIVVTGVCLMAEYTLHDLLTNIEMALANGVINSILVLGVFPVFENLFDITTKFNMLELSDLNAPIFKKMLIKAPGTYNHSLMVANMSESACKDIGANYLLARVGGYYHDIGKIEDAGMYIENKVTDRRAKSMLPQEYSKLIISHVEKGVELAKKYRLPNQIIDFIREHHGKTTMTFFYHQALESADTNGETAPVNRLDFQYPGPKPHSRETAVVMLADSVEAAARSLQEPTYVKLETLVKKIIYNKLNEDELEFSDLTMADLNRIQKSFMRILNGIFHTRIEYPDKEDLEKLEHRVLHKDDED